MIEVVEKVICPNCGASHIGAIIYDYVERCYHCKCCNYYWSDTE